MKAAAMRVLIHGSAVMACVACASCTRKPDVAVKGDTVPVATVTTPAQPVLAVSEWTLTEYGMGKLRAGMTFASAKDSLRGALVPAAKDANFAECDYAHWKGAPPGILVMVIENKIARVDVDSVGITTREGAGVGSTEAQIRAMYPGRVVESPHAYTDGHYLTVKASNPADTLFRIIFETDKGKVTNFRGGVMPGVEYVEGCS